MNRLKFLILITLFLTLPNISEGATRTISDAGGNWNSTGAWVEGVVPTISDDVVAQGDGTSGNLTINAAASCRSINLANYTGTLNHDAGITLTIGDGTAGPSNVALNFPATGWLYTIDNVITSAIAFASTTTATPQTVNFATTTGNVTFGSANTGSWQYTASHTLGSGTTLTFTRGTLDTNNQNISTGYFSSNNSNTRTLTLGSSVITITSTGTYAWHTGTVTGLTITDNTATITFTANNASANMGSKDYSNGLTINATNSGSFTLLANGSTFTNITRVGTASKYDSMVFAGSMAIEGTLTLQGNSVTNRLMVVSNSYGTQRTITNTGATMTWSNVDIQDIKLTTAYDCSAITGLCGDAGGNSGITFTTSETQTWSGTASGNWSTNAWTSRVPLPQDDVIIASAFSPAGRVITIDMPRLGRSIDFTGTTGSPTVSGTQSPNSVYMYGSLNLTGVGSFTVTSNWYFEGRGDYTLTTNGVSMNPAIMLYAPNGSLTLMDALSTANILTNKMGTLNADYNVTASRFYTDSLASSITNMGSGTWTVNSGSASAALINIGANSVINAEDSTIVYADDGASAKSFIGAGKIFNNVTFNSRTAVLSITTGSNTFDVWTLNAPNNVRIHNGDTLTLLSDPVFNSSAGNIITIDSDLDGSSATLSRSGGTNLCYDYLSLQDITAGGTSTWYAGAHSDNVSGNSGWIFTGCPAGGPNTDPRGLSPANNTIRGGFKVRGGLKFR